jgi:hypothetical protein
MKARPNVSCSVSGPLAAWSHDVIRVSRILIVPQSARMEAKAPGAGELLLTSRSSLASPPFPPRISRVAPFRSASSAPRSQTLPAGSTSVIGPVVAAWTLESVQVTEPTT